MGVDSYKMFIGLCLVLLSVPIFSFAEQYYDPTTRRYIQRQAVPSNNVSAQQRPVVNGGAYIPTQQQILQERARRRAIQLERQRRLEQIRNSPTTQNRRRFDPSRYHRTEDITIDTAS